MYLSKAIKGKGIILTCKDCNNTAGHSVDFHISQRDKLDHFVKVLGQKCNGVAGYAVLNINNTPINVELHHDGNTIAVNFLQDSNDPASIESTATYLENLFREGKGEGTEFLLTPKITYHKRLVRVGELRSAFLACTATFGYGFASTRVLNKFVNRFAIHVRNCSPSGGLLPPTKNHHFQL